MNKVQTKLNGSYPTNLDIPDPISYQKTVIDHFRANNALDNLLIVDLCQKGDCENIWKDIGDFLEINMENESVQSEQFPHVNL